MKTEAKSPRASKFGLECFVLKGVNLDAQELGLTSLTISRWNICLFFF